MYIPTASDRHILNAYYSVTGIIDLILCPLTIFLLLLSAPSYLKAFKRIQLGIVINSFLTASVFFIVRPVVTVPIAVYSIAEWRPTQMQIVFLFALAILFFGHSIIFLLITYFHRVVVLAPMLWKKWLTIFYTTFSIIFVVTGISTLGLTVYLYLFVFELQYTDRVEFAGIKVFSEVVFVETPVTERLVHTILSVLIFPLAVIGLIFGTTIYLIYKFSSNEQQVISKRTREKQRQLFRITLLQVLVLMCTMILPLLITVSGMMGVIDLPENCYFYFFIPISIHSPGNCIAVIFTPHYKKMLLRFLVVGKKSSPKTANKKAEAEPIDHTKYLCGGSGCECEKENFLSILKQ